MWKVLYSSENHPKTKSFKDLPSDDSFSQLVYFVKKEMNLNQLATRTKAWFNETSRGVEKDFSFRFRGEESYGFLRFFPALVLRFLPLLTKDDAIRRLLEFHYQLILLRRLISYAVRITNFSSTDVEEIKMIDHVFSKNPLR